MTELEIIKARCSKLPLIMSCSNAELNPDDLLAVETEFDAAETGTLIHRLAEAYITDGSDDIDHYADRLRMLDGYERAQELFPNIQRVWALAQKAFQEPELEAYYKAVLAETATHRFMITGHIDVSEIFDGVAYILDWKTGRVRDDHYHQMAGYAYLVWTEAGCEDDYVIHCTVCYADDGSLYKYSFTGKQLREWAKDVVDQLSRPRYVYNKRCVYCPLSTKCEAYQSKVTTAVATVTGADAATMLRDMSDEDRADALQKLKIVENAAKSFRTALKDDVKANGPMDTGDGREFVIKTTKTRKLNTAKALPVLQEHLTDAEVFDCASLSVAKAEACVKKRAAKGTKVAAAAALGKGLRDAGAVFYTEQSRLECQKKTEKLT